MLHIPILMKQQDNQRLLYNEFATEAKTDPNYPALANYALFCISF